MSQDNPNQEIDEVERILQEYKKKKSSDNNIKESKDILPPPIKSNNATELAKPDDTDIEDEDDEISRLVKKQRQKAEKAQEAEESSDDEKSTDKKHIDIITPLKAILKNKKVIAVIVAVVAVIGGIFIAKTAIQSSKTAYLKPYEEKYNVEFPDGILEEYCDYYGKNQKTVGCLEISDIKVKTPVYSKNAKCYPASESVAENSSQGNFVIYTEDIGLEKIYSTADAYNKSSAKIKYSDLFNEYSFKVVGAFYINKNPKDDNDYVFPYNVAEKLETDSASTLSQNIMIRMLYDTGILLTRNDRYIFISSPTEYMKDFNFVVVGVQRDDVSEKFTAKEKNDSEIHYPQAICDKLGINNPYKFSKLWYPQYEVTDPDTDDVKFVETKAEDFESKYPNF